MPEIRLRNQATQHQICRDDFFFVVQDNYDEHIELAVPFYRQMHEELVSLCPKTDGPLRVLDLGCGTGKTSAVFLANFPGTTVRAVDLFEEMLSHARARLTKFRDRVEYVQGDFRQVPLGGGYDVCASALAIHHLLADEKRDLFFRIFQALAPGGRFLMIDWTKFRNVELQSLAAGVAERHAIETVPRAEIVRAWIEHWRGKNLPQSIEDLTTWLSEAGFPSAECVMRYYGMALICAEKSK